VIARGLAALVLIACVGFVAPSAEPAREAGVTKAGIAADPVTRLEDAVENAAYRHVPGAAGSSWVPFGVERSEPGMDGREFIVATGVITTAGAPDTRVRLTGHYDPANGELVRVSHKLQPAKPESPSQGSGWSVQQAVQHAFGEVLPDDGILFALDSAQSSRVEGGGRRFDGSGIGTWGDGDARFVAFTLTLSARGELVEFDYSTQGRGEDAGYLAAY